MTPIQLRFAFDRSGSPSARRRTLLRAMLGSAAAVASWSAIGRGSRLEIGQPAPPLTLQTLEGQRISTGDLVGSVVILTFWATWCVPCREELPILSAYSARHAAQGLRVLGFSLDDGDAIEAVRRVAATLSFPVGLLGSAWAGGYGRIWSLPASFTIDRAGRLAHNNWSDEQAAWTEGRLERIVTPLLG